MTSVHRFRVDFNEFLQPDIVLLSRDDMRADVDGRPVRIERGMRVEVCEDDVDEAGAPDLLVGSGVVVPTPADAPPSWRAVKWSCRLIPPGLRHQSEIAPTK